MYTQSSFKITGGFFGFFSLLCTVFHAASSAASQIPLYWRMLGSNPVLLRLRHWQPDSLTTKLDLIHNLTHGLGPLHQKPISKFSTSLVESKQRLAVLKNTIFSNAVIKKKWDILIFFVSLYGNLSWFRWGASKFFFFLRLAGLVWFLNPLLTLKYTCRLSRICSLWYIEFYPSNNPS